MTYVEPPEGWSTFGTHVDTPGPLEFSTEVGEDGLPLWERLSDSLPDPEPFERIYGYDVEEYDPYGDGRDDREL